MNAVTLGKRDTSETGTTNTVEATTEYLGSEIAIECLDAILNSDAGRKSEVKRYWITGDVIAEAGDDGRIFTEAARHAEIERMVA